MSRFSRSKELEELLLQPPTTAAADTVATAGAGAEDASGEDEFSMLKELLEDPSKFTLWNMQVDVVDASSVLNFVLRVFEGERPSAHALRIAALLLLRVREQHCPHTAGFDIVRKWDVEYFNLLASVVLRSNHVCCWRRVSKDLMTRDLTDTPNFDGSNGLVVQIGHCVSGLLEAVGANVDQLQSALAACKEWEMWFTPGEVRWDLFQQWGLLHLAAHASLPEEVYGLLAVHCSVGSPDARGRTALHVAAAGLNRTAVLFFAKIAPEAARAEDAAGRSPLQLLLRTLSLCRWKKRVSSQHLESMLVALVERSRLGALWSREVADQPQSSGFYCSIVHTDDNIAERIISLARRASLASFDAEAVTATLLRCTRQGRRETVGALLRECVAPLQLESLPLLDECLCYAVQLVCKKRPGAWELLHLLLARYLRLVEDLLRGHTTHARNQPVGPTAASSAASPQCIHEYDDEVGAERARAARAELVTFSLRGSSCFLYLCVIQGAVEVLAAVTVALPKNVFVALISPPSLQLITTSASGSARSAEASTSASASDLSVQLADPLDSDSEALAARLQKLCGASSWGEGGGAEGDGVLVLARLSLLSLACALDRQPVLDVLLRACAAGSARSLGSGVVLVRSSLRDADFLAPLFLCAQFGRAACLRLLANVVDKESFLRVCFCTPVFDSMTVFQSALAALREQFLLPEAALLLDSRSPTYTPYTPARRRASCTVPRAHWALGWGGLLRPSFRESSECLGALLELRMGGTGSMGDMGVMGRLTGTVGPAGLVGTPFLLDVPNIAPGGREALRMRVHTCQRWLRAMDRRLQPALPAAALGSDGLQVCCVGASSAEFRQLDARFRAHRGAWRALARTLQGREMFVNLRLVGRRAPDKEWVRLAYCVCSLLDLIPPPEEEAPAPEGEAAADGAGAEAGANAEASAPSSLDLSHWTAFAALLERSTRSSSTYGSLVQTLQRPRLQLAHSAAPLAYQRLSPADVQAVRAVWEDRSCVVVMPAGAGTQAGAGAGTGAGTSPKLGAGVAVGVGGEEPRFMATDLKPDQRIVVAFRALSCWVRTVLQGAQLCEDLSCCVLPVHASAAASAASMAASTTSTAVSTTAPASNSAVEGAGAGRISASDFLRYTDVLRLQARLRCLVDCVTRPMQVCCSALSLLFCAHGSHAPHITPTPGALGALKAGAGGGGLAGDCGAGASLRGLLGAFLRAGADLQCSGLLGAGGAGGSGAGEGAAVGISAERGQERGSRVAAEEAKRLLSPALDLLLCQLIRSNSRLGGDSSSLVPFLLPLCALRLWGAADAMLEVLGTHSGDTGVGGGGDAVGEMAGAGGGVYNHLFYLVHVQPEPAACLQQYERSLRRWLGEHAHTGVGADPDGARVGAGVGADEGYGLVGSVGADLASMPVEELLLLTPLHFAVLAGRSQFLSSFIRTFPLLPLDLQALMDFAANAGAHSMVAALAQAAAAFCGSDISGDSIGVGVGDTVDGLEGAEKGGEEEKGVEEAGMDGEGARGTRSMSWGGLEPPPQGRHALLLRPLSAASLRSRQLSALAGLAQRRAVASLSLCSATLTTDCYPFVGRAGPQVFGSNAGFEEDPTVDASADTGADAGAGACVMLLDGSWVPWETFRIDAALVTRAMPAPRRAGGYLGTGHSLLHQAALLPEPHTARALIGGGDSGGQWGRVCLAVDCSGATPLFNALSKGHLSLAAEMLALAGSSARAADRVEGTEREESAQGVGGAGAEWVLDLEELESAGEAVPPANTVLEQASTGAIAGMGAESWASDARLSDLERAYHASSGSLCTQTALLPAAIIAAAQRDLQQLEASLCPHPTPGLASASSASSAAASSSAPRDSSRSPTLHAYTLQTLHTMHTLHAPLSLHLPLPFYGLRSSGATCPLDALATHLRQAGEVWAGLLEQDAQLLLNACHMPRGDTGVGAGAGGEGVCGGGELDSVVRARQILSLLGVPLSQLALRSEREHSGRAVDVTAQSFLERNLKDFRQLSPLKLKKLVSLQTAQQLRTVLCGWYRQRSVAPASALDDALFLFRSADVSVAELGESGAEASLYLRAGQVRALDRMRGQGRASVAPPTSAEAFAALCAQLRQEFRFDYASAGASADRENFPGALNAARHGHGQGYGLGLRQGQKGGDSRVLALLHSMRVDVDTCRRTLRLAYSILDLARVLCIARHLMPVTNSNANPSHNPHTLSLNNGSGIPLHPLDQIYLRIEHAQQTLVSLQELLAPHGQPLGQSQGTHARIMICDRLTYAQFSAFFLLSPALSRRFCTLRAFLSEGLACLLQDLRHHPLSELVCRLAAEAKVVGARTTFAVPQPPGVSALAGSRASVLSAASALAAPHGSSATPPAHLPPPPSPARGGSKNAKISDPAQGLAQLLSLLQQLRVGQFASEGGVGNVRLRCFGARNASRIAALLGASGAWGVPEDGDGDGGGGGEISPFRLAQGECDVAAVHEAVARTVAQELAASATATVADSSLATLVARRPSPKPMKDRVRVVEEGVAAAYAVAERLLHLLAAAAFLSERREAPLFRGDMHEYVLRAKQKNPLCALCVLPPHPQLRVGGESAWQGEQLRVCGELLRLGADPAAADGHGRVPLVLAALRGSEQLLTLLLQHCLPERLRMLREHSTLVWHLLATSSPSPQRLSSARSPLTSQSSQSFHATSESYQKCLELLLGAGFLVLAPDDSSLSCLELAALKGFGGVFGLICNKTAPAKESFARTLHVLLRVGASTLGQVRLLLSHTHPDYSRQVLGADYSAMDLCGGRVAHAARVHDAFVQRLQLDTPTKPEGKGPGKGQGIAGGRQFLSTLLQSVEAFAHRASTASAGQGDAAHLLDLDAGRCRAALTRQIEALDGGDAGGANGADAPHSFSVFQVCLSARSDELAASLLGFLAPDLLNCCRLPDLADLRRDGHARTPLATGEGIRAGADVLRLSDLLQLGCIFDTPAVLTCCRGIMRAWSFSAALTQSGANAAAEAETAGKNESEGDDDSLSDNSAREDAQWQQLLQCSGPEKGASLLQTAVACGSDRCVAYLLAQGVRVPRELVLAHLSSGRVARATKLRLLQAWLPDAPTAEVRLAGCEGMREFLSSLKHEDLYGQPLLCGETLLHVCCRLGLADVAVHLLQLGADPMAPDAQNCSALSVSIAAGQAAVTRKLYGFCPAQLQDAVRLIAYAMRKFLLRVKGRGGGTQRLGKTGLSLV